jgi:acyl dehydratase
MKLRYFEDLILGQCETLPSSHTLGEADIIAFAREWDPQPFHTDPDYALTVPQGGLTASSAHLYAIASKLMYCITPPIAGIASLRHELQIPEAARPGDTLTLSVKPVDLQPSKSKTDRGLLTLAGELQTKAGKTVLKFRSLILIYRRSISM